MTSIIFLQLFLKIYYFIVKVNEFGLAKNKSLRYTKKNKRREKEIVKIKDIDICDNSNQETAEEKDVYKLKFSKGIKNKQWPVKKYISYSTLI